MNWKAKGRVVWAFDNNFNADRIVGSKYFGSRDSKVLGEVCMAGLDPNLSTKMRPGDIMIAGNNFGYGNPHAEAILSLKEAGISVLIAQSFYPTWYRIAIFNAFPVVSCSDILSCAGLNDELEVDIRLGGIMNISTDVFIGSEPFPEFLVPIMEEGGLVSHLMKSRQ